MISSDGVSTSTSSSSGSASTSETFNICCFLADVGTTNTVFGLSAFTGSSISISPDEGLLGFKPDFVAKSLKLF